MRNSPCIPSDIQDTISDFLIVPDCSKLVPTPPLTLEKITLISFLSVAKILESDFLGGGGGGGKGGSPRKKYRISV